MNKRISTVTYFFLDFLFSVSCSLDNLPEVHKFIILDLSIVIVVDCVEKFLSRDFSKIFRPMFNCFIFLNCFWTVFVEYFEYIINYILSLLRKLLQRYSQMKWLKAERSFMRKFVLTPRWISLDFLPPIPRFL